MITSSENSHFKQLLKLVRSARARREEGVSILDGVHLLGAYLATSGVPRQVVVSQSGLANAEIQGLIAALGSVQPLVISDSLFGRLSTVETPTGILAAVSTPRAAGAPDPAVACVALEDIQDPGNLGSILRSAAAAGIRQVLLSRGSVHAWSPRVLRAGMGAHFMLRIYEQCELEPFMRAYRGRVVATAHPAQASLFKVNLTGSVALVFGNEGAGLSPALLAAAHEVVAIPMAGKSDSLNVAAAAAVCLFERRRQLLAPVLR